MTTCLYSALLDYPLPKKKKNIAPEHRGKKKHSKYTYPLSVFNKNSTLNLRLLCGKEVTRTQSFFPPVLFPANKN